MTPNPKINWPAIWLEFNTWIAKRKKQIGVAPAWLSGRSKLELQRIVERHIREGT